MYCKPVHSKMEDYIMKAARILVGVAVVLMALFGTGLQKAQASMFTYTSGFQVQNTDTVNPAVVTIDFYNGDGTQPANSEIKDSIPAGTNKTYFPLTTVPSGFQGSVVVSSSTKVASIVNILGSGGAQPVGAAYVGATAGSPTLLIPLLMKGNGGFNTWFSVQNTGSSAADITANYSDGTLKTISAVQPGAAAIFDQSTETHSVKVFSAVVSSTGNTPLASAVIEESPSVIDAYSGVIAGSTTVVFPLINANNAGNLTGITIQNAGSSDTTVTLSYTPSDASSGTACTETQTIPHGQSNTFAFLTFAGVSQPGVTTNCIGKAKFVGSAIVTANSTNQPLVAIVNQLKPGVNGEAYNAFDPASATNQVVLPLIMDHNSNWWTGFSVMNVGSASTNVTCTFSNSTYTVSKPLGQNQSFTDLQYGKLAPAGGKYVGSGTCTADGSGKIVAVVNELNTVNVGANLLVYEGIPVTP